MHQHTILSLCPGHLHGWVRTKFIGNKDKEAYSDSFFQLQNSPVPKERNSRRVETEGITRK